MANNESIKADEIMNEKLKKWKNEKMKKSWKYQVPDGK